MLNPIKEIAKWQKDAGNTAKPYEDFLESSFQIEEALEGFGDLPYLQVRLHSEGKHYEELCNPKEISRQIVRLAEMDSKPTNIPDVDRLDKACDAVVFAIGSMAKLGLTPAQIIEAMNIVTEANLQKLSNIKVDSSGKLLKGSNFVGPETKLQALLDSNK